MNISTMESLDLKYFEYNRPVSYDYDSPYVYDSHSANY